MTVGKGFPAKKLRLMWPWKRTSTRSRDPPAQQPHMPTSHSEWGQARKRGFIEEYVERCKHLEEVLHERCLEVEACERAVKEVRAENRAP